MAAPPRAKRGPSVLVTDARELAFKRPGILQRQSTRLISVDNVLQYASEIPSGQRRGPPRPATHARTPSGLHPLDPRLSGRLAQQHIPQRSSKLSEKLVLLPDTSELELEKGEFAIDDDATPPRDSDLARRQKPVGLKEKSYAERLPKSSRTDKLSRVTAYCTAQAYKMQATAAFVRTKHGAKTKLYDDCLYTVYHLPLLPGNEGYRIRSSPVLKSPGGKAVLDEEIERNERHDYRDGYFGGDDYGVIGHHEGHESDDNGPKDGASDTKDADAQSPRGRDEEQNEENERDRHDESPRGHHLRNPSSPLPDVASNASTFGEMFIFSYGVVVFWNFTERQEKDILADLTFSSAPGAGGTPLAVRPQLEEDFETEEFHFEYNQDIARPRMFNDMITLRSGDHMIKLSMSHAIAQSTKLGFFEERMAETMGEAAHVPRRLALRGELGMKREEVVRILGKLFMSRVDVNLSSNVLDVPNFFWDSEPTLHPLYSAVREYLEIKPRIQVLNERCRVFLDLAEILSDSIADRKMSRITWIIIILIVLSILVTCSETFLRFDLISRGKEAAGESSSSQRAALLRLARLPGGVSDL